ncbi:MAG: hypothetical protein V2I43_25385 [Parvularcula sp.]|jgi:hypothetical protein|nr:hypothetical protein [Parvularcula sp.]
MLRSHNTGADFKPKAVADTASEPRFGATSMVRFDKERGWKAV